MDWPGDFVAVTGSAGRAAYDWGCRRAGVVIPRSAADGTVRLGDDAGHGGG